MSTTNAERTKAFLKRPLVFCVLNLVALIGTIVSVSYLLSFGQLRLCKSIYTGLRAVCGVVLATHCFYSVLFVYNTWKFNRFPWSVSDVNSQGLYESLNPEMISSRKPVFYNLRLKKVSLISLTVFVYILVLVMYSGAGVVSWVRKVTVAPNSGTLKLPGLEHDGEIIFSPEGVPLIDAETESDSWYLLGVTHARSRMWQTQFQRLLCSGQLSTAVGEAALNIDKLFLTLGVYEAADRDWRYYQQNEPGIVPILERYSEGYNDYVRAATPKYLPLEFRLLGLKSPPAWTPTDSLCWVKIMSYDLSGNMKKEAKRFIAHQIRQLSLERMEEFYTPYDVLNFPTVLTEEDMHEDHLGPNLDPDVVPASETGADGDRGKDWWKEAPPDAAVSPALAAKVANLIQLQRTRGAKNQGNTERIDNEGLRFVGSNDINDMDSVGARNLWDEAIEKDGDLLENLMSIANDPLNYSDTPLSRSLATTFSVLRSIGELFEPSKAVIERGDDAEAPQATGGQERGYLRTDPSVGASNNWVVGGALVHPQGTEHPSYAILNDDPHLRLLAPSLWQMVHIRSKGKDLEEGATTINTKRQELNVVGSSFPGIPSLAIGRNKWISWGVTNTGVDVQDLYVMEPDPENPDTHYIYEGQKYAYEIKQYRLQFPRGGKKKEALVKVRRTHLGYPIVTDNNVVTGVLGAVMALRWVSVDPKIPDTTLKAFYELQSANSWKQFREALAVWVAPSQNVIYADIYGNFGYQMPGWIPTRTSDPERHTGLYPVPGNVNDYLWGKAFPYDELPRTFNPPKGYVASANNRVTPPNWPYYVSGDWDTGGDGYRARRIETVIKKGGNNTPYNPPNAMAPSMSSASSSSYSFVPLSRPTKTCVVPVYDENGHTKPGETREGTCIDVEHMRELQRDVYTTLADDMMNILNTFFNNPDEYPVYYAWLSGNFQQEGALGANNSGRYILHLLNGWNRVTSKGSLTATVWSRLMRKIFILGSRELKLEGKTSEDPGIYENTVFTLRAILSEHPAPRTNPHNGEQLYRLPEHMQTQPKSDPACSLALQDLRKLGHVAQELLESNTPCMAVVAAALNQIAAETPKIHFARLPNGTLQAGYGSLQGDDPSNLYKPTFSGHVPAWGVDVHRAMMKHEVLGQTVAGCMANRLVNHGGDKTCVNVGGYDYFDDAHVMEHGASYKQVVYMGDRWENPDVQGSPSTGNSIEDEILQSWFINPLGQDGDLFSKNYDDLLHVWAEGGYVPMVIDTNHKNSKRLKCRAK